MSETDPPTKPKQPDTIDDFRASYDKRRRADLTFAWRYLALIGGFRPFIFLKRRGHLGH
jgi:hypothetical protein